MTINFHAAKYFIKHYFSAKRKGHSVHSPFAYHLCEEVFYNENQFYDFERFNKIRNELLNNKTEVTVQDFGAGSKNFDSDKRRVDKIARVGISTAKQSELLYKLINFLKPATVVELGTSIGLNTLYLASAGKTKVYTIEGSPVLSKFAKQLAEQQKINNCEFIEGKFDKEFPELLNKINTLDLLYIDGNHTYEATMNYFNLALKKKNNNSVFVFDDIYWSEGMTKAWEEIKKDPAVTLSIDTFYSGIVFFREEIKEGISLRLRV